MGCGKQHEFLYLFLNLLLYVVVCFVFCCLHVFVCFVCVWLEIGNMKFVCVRKRVCEMIPLEEVIVCSCFFVIMHVIHYVFALALKAFARDCVNFVPKKILEEESFHQDGAEQDVSSLVSFVTVHVAPLSKYTCFILFPDRAKH